MLSTALHCRAVHARCKFHLNCVIPDLWKLGEADIHDLVVSCCVTARRWRWRKLDESRSHPRSRCVPAIVGHDVVLLGGANCKGPKG